MISVFAFVRVFVVIALVVIAAAMATPPGRLPLAIRGLAKIIRRDRGISAAEVQENASNGRKIVAFLLVVVAAILAII